MSVCSLIAMLDDYFSVSYLSTVTKGPALVAGHLCCTVFPTFCLARLLRDTGAEALCSWGGFSYSKTHKCTFHISAQRSDYTSKLYLCVGFNKHPT